MLDPDDVDLLVDGLEAMVAGVQKAHAGEERLELNETLQAHVEELRTLREKLASSSRSLLDPLRLDVRESRLLRRVLGDITGYQRGELTPGLRELRQLLLPD